MSTYPEYPQILLSRIKGPPVLRTAEIALWAFHDGTFDLESRDDEDGVLVPMTAGDLVDLAIKLLLIAKERLPDVPTRVHAEAFGAATKLDHEDAAILDLLMEGEWHLGFDDYEYVVDQVIGPRNDREWVERGRGDTRRESLLDAVQNQRKKTNPF